MRTLSIYIYTKAACKRKWFQYVLDPLGMVNAYPIQLDEARWCMRWRWKKPIIYLWQYNNRSSFPLSARSCFFFFFFILWPVIRGKYPLVYDTFSKDLLTRILRITGWSCSRKMCAFRESYSSLKSVLKVETFEEFTLNIYLVFATQDMYNIKLG